MSDARTTPGGTRAYGDDGRREQTEWLAATAGVVGELAGCLSAPTTEDGGQAAPPGDRAYPVETVREAGVIDGHVGRLPVVVAAGPTPHTYVRRVDDRVPVFEPAGDGRTGGAGSQWSAVTGRAVSGAHEGRRPARRR